MFQNESEQRNKYSKQFFPVWAPSRYLIIKQYSLAQHGSQDQHHRIYIQTQMPLANTFYASLRWWPWGQYQLWDIRFYFDLLSITVKPVRHYPSQHFESQVAASPKRSNHLCTVSVAMFTHFATLNRPYFSRRGRACHKILLRNNLRSLG